LIVPESTYILEADFFCMTLDSLTDGAQRHVHGYMDSPTKSLITILCLPLVDGVFVTMLVSGSMQSLSSIFSIAITIFAGAGALAVLYSTTEDSKHARITVLKAAPILVLGAVIVSLIAPVYSQLVNVEIMKQVAGLALLAIAGKMYGVRRVESVSVPVIVVTGLVVSLQNPSSLSLTFSYVYEAFFTVLIALMILMAATLISRDLIRLSAFRKGASAVLVSLALPMLGIGLPQNTPILMLSASLAYSLQLPFERPRFLRARTGGP